MKGFFSLTASISAFALLQAAASAGVLVVGPPGSGAAFQDVQPAIDAAQPGDTVLVLAGSYGTASITKPLQLVGAGSGLVTLSGPQTQHVLQVGSIPAGETVVVAGLDLQAGFEWATLPKPLARIAGNAGTVVIQDVVLEDQPDLSGFASGGMDVVSSALVLVESCTVRGGDGGGVGVTTPGISTNGSTVWIMNSTLQGGSRGTLPGADGIASATSTVYLAATDVQGGAGGSPFGCGLEGGDGVSMSGGLLKAVGAQSHVGGGDAGWTFSTFACAPGAGLGGAGIRLVGGAHAIVAASVGVDGGQHDGVLHVGSAEPIVSDAGSSVNPSPFLYPTLAASQPTVVVGSGVTLALNGNPSALGTFALALEPASPTSFPGIDGAVILGSGAKVLATVALDVSGMGSLSLSVPPNPALVGLVGVFQALETGAPQVAVSNPVFVTISG